MVREILCFQTLSHVGSKELNLPGLEVTVFPKAALVTHGVGQGEESPGGTWAVLSQVPTRGSQALAQHFSFTRKAHIA